MEAMVISMDKDSKKIALSLKAAKESGEKGGNYSKQEVKTATLADKLKDFNVSEEE